MVIEDSPPGTRILINAPLTGFSDDDRVLLVIYALPNGNTIEQTTGKRLKEGDDWHFDIQHIGAKHVSSGKSSATGPWLWPIWKTAGKAGRNGMPQHQITGSR